MLSYLKSAHSNFSDCKFHEKTKMSKFETSNLWFRYFWIGIWKICCQIWNQHPRICLIAKYCEIMKVPKIGTKSVLFPYFWARILQNYWHIWNQQLRISVIVKFCEETKMPKLWTKTALFGSFWPKEPHLDISGREF